MTDRIRMDVQEVPTEKCYPNPWNPNRTTMKVDEAIRESMGALGQWSPITVRPHPDEADAYQVLDGEHRLEQAIALEWPTIAVNVIHGLSEDEARKITIIANETRGRADRVQLGILLAEIQDMIQDEEELSVAMPWADDEIENLIELAGHNWDDTGGNAWENVEAANESRENPNIATFHISHPVEGAETLERVLLDKLKDFPDASLKVT